MDEKVALLTSELTEARSVIAALQAENDGLKVELARLRALLRSREQQSMSTKLKDALRE